MNFAIYLDGGITTQRRIISSNFKTQYFDYASLVGYILETRITTKRSYPP